MSQNLISADLSEAALTQIAEHVTAIRALLPFLIDLDTDDRRKLLVMGAGTLGFADDAVDLTRQHGDILPRSFSSEELQRDRALYGQMVRLQNLIDPLKDLIDDTALAVGSDLFQGALEVYTFAKAAGKGTGLEERVKTMGKRFVKRRRTRVAEAAEA